MVGRLKNQQQLISPGILSPYSTEEDREGCIIDRKEGPKYGGYVVYSMNKIRDALRKI
jgi:hypothetical protein